MVREPVGWLLPPVADLSRFDSVDVSRTGWLLPIVDVSPVGVIFGCGVIELPELRLGVLSTELFAPKNLSVDLVSGALLCRGLVSTEIDRPLSCLMGLSISVSDTSDIKISNFADH